MGKVTSRASVSEVREKLRASEQLGGQTARRFDELAGRFEAFLARGFGLEQVGDITPAHVEAFVKAKADGKEPAVATMHMRRSALRLLFRVARQEFNLQADPTIDVILPSRAISPARPLTEDEVALCRSYSLHMLTATRQPAAWALGEVTATTAELGHITVDDLDLENGRVWLHGSNKRVERWGYLDDWGATQLERRAKALRATKHLIYRSTGSGESRQASCSNAIRETLIRAGLDTEPDVRPPSLGAWAGLRILKETGRIEEVARRLGFRSLDAAGSFIGFDWQQ